MNDDAQQAAWTETFWEIKARLTHAFDRWAAAPPRMADTCRDTYYAILEEMKEHCREKVS